MVTNLLARSKLYGLLFLESQKMFHLIVEESRAGVYIADNVGNIFGNRFEDALCHGPGGWHCIGKCVVVSTSGGIGRGGTLGEFASSVLILCKYLSRLY